MLRVTPLSRFYMRGGNMYVDYKILSRDHKRSIRVEEALVDPCLATTIAPLSWLEQLRSPSTRLPKGFHLEEAVYASPHYGDRAVAPALATYKKFAKPHAPASSQPSANAIRAGPVVLYITGQQKPIVLNPIFVPDRDWGLLVSRRANTTVSSAAASDAQKGEAFEELDLRLGMDAIEQCSLFTELRPGGFLYSKLPSHATLEAAMEPAQDVLKRYGMKCGLAESPLVARPWTRMRYMFIDELQRGPKMTEFVGFNPRSGTPWRFSQHTRYFRGGIWKETIRRNEMNDGLHAHSSWQKSPQQAVPEVSFMAPFP